MSDSLKNEIHRLIYRHRYGRNWLWNCGTRSASPHPPPGPCCKSTAAPAASRPIRWPRSKCTSTKTTPRCCTSTPRHAATTPENISSTKTPPYFQHTIEKKAQHPKGNNRKMPRIFFPTSKGFFSREPTKQHIFELNLEAAARREKKTSTTARVLHQ